MYTAFTPLKRQLYRLTPVGTDDEKRPGIDSPPRDNSLEQQSTMHDILTIQTPTFKVKPIIIKPDPAKLVLTGKESVQDTIQKQKEKTERVEKERKRTKKI